MNDYEKEIAERLRRQGWTVLSRGWPDFLCVNRTVDELDLVAESPHCNRARDIRRGRPLRIFSAELKRNGDKLSAHQARVHTVLKLADFPCAVFSEEKIKSLLKNKGSLFCGTESRSLLLSQVQAAERELLIQAANLQGLKKTIEACVLMFDDAEQE